MNEFYRELGISDAAEGFVRDVEERLADAFHAIEETEYYNQAKVLRAFAEEGVAARHFAPSSGYGYDDVGRDTLDRVFAHALCAEDALVRPQLTSGTHTLFTALAGLLEPGDTMLAITGKPYDTLENAIGISGDAYGSLARMGVKYEQVDLSEDGHININAATDALLHNDSVKLVYMQRSRGYAWRNSLMPEEMGEAIKAVRAVRPDCFIMVDNCYGEFTREHEPTEFGADVIAGSLIKNPGGGIAPTGGYIAGTKRAIERIEMRLTVPGMGREVGSYAGSYAPFYEGLFLAPHVTAQSVKTAVLFAGIFEALGMESMPSSEAARSDIVQAIRFKTADSLIAFCKSVQKASPVDSFVTPEPWDMPGYTSQVIMAAGAFVQGSSIELSADAPIREPYTAYIQGGLTYGHGRTAAMMVLSELIRSGEITL